MTDKQIIIDKLKNDIACKENIINHLADTNIELQKQLKRKEQECDMWKNLTIDNGAVALKYQQQLDQLKAELEAYKKSANVREMMSKEKKCEQCKNCICKSCVQVAWLQEMLKEIKEIAEKYEELHGFLDCSGDLILQKISEVV